MAILFPSSEGGASVTLTHCKIVAAWVTLACAPLASAWAEDTVFGITASVYTGTAYDSDSGGRKSYRLNLGGSGGFDYGYLTGPHQLGARYRRSLSGSYGNNGLSRNTSISGASFYRYERSESRLDIEAGHNIRSVNTGEGYIIDATAYTTQQSVYLDGGLNFRPGTLTRLRVSSRVGATFYEDEARNGKTAKSEASLRRKLSEQSTLGGSVSRTLAWQNSTNEPTVIDNVQGSYHRSLENGQLMVAMGMTRASTGSVETQGITGQARRSWRNSQGETTFAYRRGVTSTLIELTQEDFMFWPDQAEADSAESLVPEEPEPLQIQSLALRDSVLLDHKTELCSLCILHLSSEAARVEDIYTRRVTYNYSVGGDLNLTVSPIEEAGVSYSWQGQAEEKPTAPLHDQAHRVSLRWQRNLAERAQVSARVNQAWLRGAERAWRFSARLAFSFRLGSDF